MTQSATKTAAPKASEAKRSASVAVAKKTISKPAAPKNAAATAAKKEVSPKQTAPATLTVTGRFVRIAPRKVRLAASQFMNMPAEEALERMRFLVKASSRPLQKLLASAIASAEQNLNWERADVILKSIRVNDGPIIKRYRPRAHGRSAMLRKRMSHVYLTVALREGAIPSAQKPNASTAQPKVEEVKVVSPEEIKKEGPKGQGGGDQAGGSSDSGFLKKVFQRKTG